MHKLNPGPDQANNYHHLNHSTGNPIVTSQIAVCSRSPVSKQKGANLHNLYYLKPANFNVCKTLRFCTWNAQVVRNKTAVIQDYLCHEKIDLCAITESWMKTKDTAVRAERTPSGYSIADFPRPVRSAGGIAIIYRSTLKLAKVNTGVKTSFEFAEHLVSSGTDKLRMVVMYRTPYSQVQRVNISTFLDEFADYMEPTINTSEPLLITGDINIHVDVPDDPNIIRFLDLLDSMGLVQHVKTPTHKMGHTG